MDVQDNVEYKIDWIFLGKYHKKVGYISTDYTTLIQNVKLFGCEAIIYYCLSLKDYRKWNILMHCKGKWKHQSCYRKKTAS